MKPNLNRIIEDNLDKAKFQSKLQPSLPKNTGWLDGYADGGEPSTDLFKTNKVGFVDSTLNANKDKDWVNRLYDKNPKTIHVPGTPQGSVSTHYMGDDGKGYVFPTVVNINGKLQYLGDKAEDYARQTNTGIQFNKKQGDWFAGNGYKKGTGVLNGFADGGLLSKKVTCSNCGWSWKAVDGGIDPMTCHKCGGMIKMKQGGETYISGKALATQFGQYDEGGEPLRKLPNNQPTTQDSLILYNNQLLKDKFYKNNTNYTQSSSGTNNKDIPSIIGLLDFFKNLPPYPDQFRSFPTTITAKEAAKRYGKISQNVYSSPDIRNGEPDSYFNPLAPPSYFSDKILPIKWNGYRSGIYKDMSDVPMYDAIAVKPAAMKTPADWAYMEKTYGITPPTQSKKQTTKPTQQTKVYTNKAEFDRAMQAFNDSLNLYNLSTSRLKALDKEEEFTKTYDSNDLQQRKQMELLTTDFLKKGDALFNYNVLHNIKGGYNINKPQERYNKNRVNFKKPNTQPVYQKEVHHTNPGMGEIVGRENNLQVAPETGLIDRSLQRINTEQQPTNYSFHYPIEGDFNRGNPQGVKYFNDRAEWQKFLDENDYNSAEEKNGSGQASGTLKKGKYGGWLDKYPEGGENSTGYVAPTMPNLGHPGGSDIQNRGFQKPIAPILNKKQVQELEKKNKHNAEQLEKVQYLSPYNQPLGRDYEANRVQKIKDWGAENGYTVTDDGKLITDDAIHKFMESKFADQLWNRIVAPIGTGVGLAYTGGLAAKIPIIAETAAAVAPALEAPLLGTLGAEYGTGALTTSNLLNAGFAYQGAKNIPNVYNSWKNVSNTPTWGNVGNAAAETALTGLDMLPFLHGAAKGIPSVVQDINQAGKYLTTQTPLKNTYKINPSIKIDNQPFEQLISKEGTPFITNEQVSPTNWKLEVPQNTTITLKSVRTGSPLEKQVNSKGEISINNLKNYLKKPEISEADRNILQKVIDEKLQGKTKIDYNDFKQHVYDELVPLEPSLRSDNANYGLSRLGYPGPQRKSFEAAITAGEENNLQLQKKIKDLESYHTELNNYKLRDGENAATHLKKLHNTESDIISLKNDLKESINKINLNKKQLLELPKENSSIIYQNKERFGKGSQDHFSNDEALMHSRYFVNNENPEIFHSLEGQSDFYQKANEFPSIEKLQKQSERLNKQVNTNNEILKDLDYRFKNNINDVTGFPIQEYQIKQYKEIADAQKRALDLHNASSSNALQKYNLGKTHLDRLLQEEIHYAGNNGQQIYRRPTPETAAKIQGYTKVTTERPIGHEGFWDVNTNGEYSKEHQTILKKYADFPKQAKKVLGVEPKVVTDSKGNSWYELPIPESFKNGSAEINAFKYGGWLSKYEDGGPGDKYVPPVMPDLRHPGQGSGYQNIDRTIPLMGSTVPNDPNIVRKIEKEKAANELALRKQASQVMKQKGNTHFTFPNGDYKPYKDMNFRERSYVEGLALDQDTRINKDEDSVLDFFNPLHLIGSMGKDLAQAPYVAKQTNSYLPYVTGIGNPLLAGRMMGSGSMNPLSSKMWTNEISNKAFINSLAGGIPGAIEKIPSTLKNAGNFLKEETALNKFFPKKQQPLENYGWGTDQWNASNQLPPPPTEIHINPVTGSVREVHELQPLVEFDPNSINLRRQPSLVNSWNESKPIEFKNKSGLTKEEVLKKASAKDKDIISKMSENEFKETVLKPNGEVVKYGTNNGNLYNIANESTFIPHEEYIKEFNKNIDDLNNIIASKNKSGVHYKVKELRADATDKSYGNLIFETPHQEISGIIPRDLKIQFDEFHKNPEKFLIDNDVLKKTSDGKWILDNDKSLIFNVKEDAINHAKQLIAEESAKHTKIKSISGESEFLVKINPGKWKGNVEDVVNEHYYKNIPGLNMFHSRGVFSDYVPRKGTGAYDAINEYLKKYDLGRVKPGFNSQSQYSRGLWENAIQKGKAVGYYDDPRTIYGVMKTVVPAVGIGATALNKEKYGGDISIPSLNNNWLNKYIKNK